MKVIFLLLVFILFLSTVKTNCQTVGGSIMLGLPQGEFKDNLNRAGYGFQIQGTFSSTSKYSPVSVGLNLGYMIYGEESSLRPLSIYIPDALVEVNRTNSLLNYHLLILISPFEGSVRPYLEGLIGGAYIFTRTSVSDEYNEESVFSTTNFDDHNFSYGGSVGLLIPVGTSEDDDIEFFVDLKVRYLLSNKAEYLREGDIIVQGGALAYNVSESRTDLLTIHAGVSVQF